MSYDFRQKQGGRYVIHVYRANGRHNEYFYDDLALARKFCGTSFKQSNVYKVKLWDTLEGPIEPNNPNAAALVVELV